MPTIITRTMVIVCLEMFTDQIAETTRVRPRRWHLIAIISFGTDGFVPFLYPELCAIKSANRYLVMGYAFNNESAFTFRSNRATIAECYILFNSLHCIDTSSRLTSDVSNRKDRMEMVGEEKI